jgi:hypothetical protein
MRQGSETRLALTSTLHALCMLAHVVGMLCLVANNNASIVQFHRLAKSLSEFAPSNHLADYALIFFYFLLHLSSMFILFVYISKDHFSSMHVYIFCVSKDHFNCNLINRLVNACVVQVGFPLNLSFFIF